MAGPYQPSPIENLLVALDEAVDLLHEFSGPAELALLAEPNPGSLLDQCLELCAQRDATALEPVRTLHHFACAGGTLISKCLSAMPNMQILSEVDPLSTLLVDAATHFAPTDMVALLRQSTQGVSDQLIVEIFQASLALVLEDCSQKGQRLLLRDHAHSHYCHGRVVPQRANLLEIVRARFPVLSAVTVRQPLDSYLSLVNNGWISYAPAGLNEYCRRYLRFLDDHAALPLLRYEDFIDAPQKKMRELCGVLRLPYAEGFVDLFDVFKLTGDSGRTGNTIGPRARRPVDENVAREVDESPHYAQLLLRLEYAN